MTKDTNPLPCVVVGFKFNAGNLSLPERKDFLKAFLDQYIIKLPVDNKVEFAEGQNTDMAVYALGGSNNDTISGNQDGGNGAGGDAGGKGTHWFAGLETRAKFSFWKIDSRPFRVQSVDEKIAKDIKSQTYKTGASDRAVEIQDLHRTGGDPGCAFYFSSVDAAYAWLTNATQGFGGSAMYELYGQVMIIGVNASNPVKNDG